MFGAFNLTSKAAVSITPNKNCSHRISTPVYIYLEIIYWRTTLLSSCKAQMFSHGIFPLWGCHLKMLNGVLWILFNLSTLTKQRLQKNCCPYPLHFICRELKGKPGSQQNNFSYSDLGQPGQGWVWGESKSSFLGRTDVVFAPAGGLCGASTASPAPAQPFPAQPCLPKVQAWVDPGFGLQPEPLLLPPPACPGKTRHGSIFREGKDLFVGYRKELQAQGLEQPGKWVLLRGVGAEYSVGFRVANKHARSHSGMGCRNSYL